MPEIDGANTAWVLTSAALVMLMTPGLAFFYGGMVRSKNVLAMLMHNYVTIGIVSVLWVLVTYSLAFGPDLGGGLLGDLRYAGLLNQNEAIAGYEGDFAQTIPPLAFVAFQLMFAIITPALFTGAIADRMKFGGFVLLVALWTVLVYAPVAHWVFSPNGWLFGLGALDFAGGTVVHINAGAAGLALAIVLGKRRGWPREPMKPHNLPFTLLGAGILWFGWFGFNAGSALGANGLAAQAFVNTHVATGAALLAWIGVEKLRDGHATTLGAASGAVAGLVAVTPAAGLVNGFGAVCIGLMAGGACALFVPLKFKLGYDDALDVVGVHLVGGVVGSLAVGLFATTSVNSLGGDGLLYGGGLTLLGKQWVAVLAVTAFSFVATFLLAKIVQAVIGLRVDDTAEVEGLDFSQHAESAYDFGGLPAGSSGISGPRPHVDVRDSVSAGATGSGRV